MAHATSEDSDEIHAYLRSLANSSHRQRIEVYVDFD